MPKLCVDRLCYNLNWLTTSTLLFSATPSVRWLDWTKFDQRKPANIPQTQTQYWRKMKIKYVGGRCQATLDCDYLPLWTWPPIMYINHIPYHPCFLILIATLYKCFTKLLQITCRTYALMVFSLTCKFQVCVYRAASVQRPDWPDACHLKSSKVL